MNSINLASYQDRRTKIHRKSRNQPTYLLESFHVKFYSFLVGKLSEEIFSDPRILIIVYGTDRTGQHVVTRAPIYSIHSLFRIGHYSFRASKRSHVRLLSMYRKVCQCKSLHKDQAIFQKVSGATTSWRYLKGNTDVVKDVSFQNIGNGLNLALCICGIIVSCIKSEISFLWLNAY